MIRIFNQYVSVKSLLLAGLETVLILLSLVCGARLRFVGDPAGFSQFAAMPGFALQAGLFVLMFQVCFYYCGLYNLSATRNPAQQVAAVLESLGAACLLLGLLYYIFPSFVLGRGVLFLSTVFVAAGALVSRLVSDHAWNAGAFHETVVILGAGELGATVASEMARRKDLSMQLAGFIAVEPDRAMSASASAAAPHVCGPCFAAAAATEIAGHPILGTVADLDRIASDKNISRIVVALEDRRGTLPIGQLVKLRVQGIRIEDAHTAIASLSGRVWLETVRPSWFVFSDGFHRSKSTLILKRSVDLALGIVGLALAAPVMFLLAAAIRLDSKGPVIYRQTRTGLGGRPFSLLKFRSMRADAEAFGGVQWAAEDDPRVTRAGRFIRKYRLDELPQFLNVVRGEMSFVGPRPERPVFVEQLRGVISYYDERHSVRPGLTGWAQVQYRYGASVEDAARKLEYDLFYLQNMSLSFDLAIVLKTVRIMLTGFGAR
ncbi:MAG: sugar transferase [Acidobacteriia bacterium]|nr:sugar transferase [Terriglobia bacterium]